MERFRTHPRQLEGIHLDCRVAGVNSVIEKSGSSYERFSLTLTLMAFSGLALLRTLYEGLIQAN